MESRDKLIRVYSADEFKVILLKNELEMAGILSSIQNNSLDSFLRGTPAAVDLYIQQSDYQKAEQIINAFIEQNKS
jgi:hypothetical protein